MINVEPGMDTPCGWIQWKGTDVCIDLHCQCGELLHFDGDFLYHFKCGECGQVYQVGAFVKLYAIDHEPEGTKTVTIPEWEREDE